MQGERYVTKSGQTRQRRVPPGELARRIRTVCTDWVKDPDSVESASTDYLTASEIRRELEDRHGRDVSYYGVQHNLAKWEEMGFIVAHRGPWGFESFTQESATVGYSILESEWRDRRSAEKQTADETIEYRPVEQEEHWSQATSYKVEV